MPQLHTICFMQGSVEKDNYKANRNVQLMAKYLCPLPPQGSFTAIRYNAKLEKTHYELLQSASGWKKAANKEVVFWWHSPTRTLLLCLTRPQFYSNSECECWTMVEGTLDSFFVLFFSTLFHIFVLHVLHNLICC